LPEEVELVVYRVAQEALTNALRHSDGTEVNVSLRRTDHRVTLIVADNGRGLPSVRRDGGLRGMRERAMLIGAELEISSPTGQGTEIKLTVPIERAAA
jgi:two-component system sensor histidine kinase UhpB